MHNLFSHVYPIYLSSAIGESATSTDFATVCVDTRGYEGVAFIVPTRTCGDASFSLYAQLSATSSADGTFVDVYGSTVTHTTGFNQAKAMEVIDVYKPKYRWARVYVDRATTGEQIGDVIALLYRPQTAAVGFSTAFGVSDVNIVVGTSS